MEELSELLISQGLSAEQVQLTMKTITEWLHLNYPVAGAILDSWLKSQSKQASKLSK
jgi:hypothetical protein